MPRIRGTKEEISDKKRQFGMWLGLPQSVRSHKTQVELAKQMETTETTLAHWRKDTEVLGAKESAVKMPGGNDMYAVTRTIVDKAKEGNFQMSRLYMEWQGQIGGKKAEKSEPLVFELRYGTKKDRNTD